MRKISNFQRGMGMGGWLTNYKRFNVLSPERRMQITVGDMEHFESYITESDVKYIASLGMDHIRVGFDQIVLEESPYVYRENIIALLHEFIKWCRKGSPPHKGKLSSLFFLLLFSFCYETSSFENQVNLNYYDP